MFGWKRQRLGDKAARTLVVKEIGLLEVLKERNNP